MQYIAYNNIQNRLPALTDPLNSEFSCDSEWFSELKIDPNFVPTFKEFLGKVPTL